MITILGENFAARDDKGNPKVHIATALPAARTIVTIPGTHFTQRLAYVDSVNAKRHAEDLGPLTEAEQLSLMDESVDLIADERGVMIRPDPSRMDLAFQADEMLQELMPKKQIKYLGVSDARVHQTLRRRGECWRMYLPPTTVTKMIQMIKESRVAIGLSPIYYFSAYSGTRFLTLDTLRGLLKLDDMQLRNHLKEIARIGKTRNRLGHRELVIFMGDDEISPEDFAPAETLPDKDLRPWLQQLCDRLSLVIPKEFHIDDPEDPIWRNRIYASLLGERDDVLVDQQTLGIDPDFLVLIEWMPGARIVDGELLLDTSFDETLAPANAGIISPVLRGIILNLVQEFGNLQYINIGSVLASPDRPTEREGRREVYVVQLNQRATDSEIILVNRMLKWGVRERLNDGNSLEQAMMGTEEYIQYVGDRRLACKQLGMNLPAHVSVRKVREIYHGRNEKYNGCTIWSPYIQRGYVAGVATNRLLARNLAQPQYANAFARLLGAAAACNIILGRAELPNHERAAGPNIFDSGDEILTEDACGLPAQLVVTDHVGTLVDWEGTLESRTAAYAIPVLQRLDRISDREAFSMAYLNGFVDRLHWIQSEYARYKRAFDTLFKHLPFDPAGSLAYRWFRILERLAKCNPQALGTLVGQAIQNAKA